MPVLFNASFAKLDKTIPLEFKTFKLMILFFFFLIFKIVVIDICFVLLFAGDCWSEFKDKCNITGIQSTNYDIMSL